MSFLKRILNAILPEDSDVGCGYGPFKLDPMHPFTRGCSLHDYEFDEAHRGRGTKSLAQVDWELFYRWVTIANAATTYEEKCELARDACRYWPYARSFGGYMWDGPPE